MSEQNHHERERVSVGWSGFSVEGKISTLLFFALIAALVIGAFATGKASVILDSCFGARRFW
ncbi:hypothetical protein ACVWZM_002967 [Bradyrhizobium sp. USDA 4501]